MKKFLRKNEVVTLNISRKDITKDNSIPVGIGLGTTNSLISYYDGNKPCIIPDKKGRYFEPSIVAYSNKEQKFIVGHEAINDNSAIYSIKRFIGKSSNNIFSNPDIFLNQSHKKVKNIKYSKEIFNPIRISSEILKKLKKKSRKFFTKRC